MAEVNYICFNTDEQTDDYSDALDELYDNWYTFVFNKEEIPNLNVVIEDKCLINKDDHV